MIRLIGRKLIIPQGDTGSFTIPTQGTVSTGDVAIFSIYDNLMNTTVCEKKINATSETLTFNFMTEDTLNIETNDKGDRYSWDITIQRNPIYDDQDNVIGYGDIDSYYAGYRLPPCLIKKVTRNVHQQQGENT